MYKAASLGLLRSTPLRSYPSSLFKPLSPSRISASLVGSRSFGLVRPLGVLSGSLRYTCGSDRRSSLLSPRAVIGDKPSAVLDRFERKIATMAEENPFKGILTSLPKPGGGEFGKYFSFAALNDPRIDKLPYSIRILLESAIRNCDNFQVTKDDVEKIVDWENSAPKLVEIPFKPARVLLQDFTGVPAVVDLACMRDAMNNLGSDSNKINPLECGCCASIIRFRWRNTLIKMGTYLLMLDQSASGQQGEKKFPFITNAWPSQY